MENNLDGKCFVRIHSNFNTMIGDEDNGKIRPPHEVRPHSGNSKYEQRKLKVKRDSTSQRRPWTTPAQWRSGDILSAGSSRSSLDQTSKIQNWLSEKAVKNVQEKADPEAKETKSMYMSVLDRENTFVRDVDNFLLHKAFLDYRKKEMLYKAWCEKIAEPTEAKIYQEMKNNFHKVDKHKRRLYDQYLKHGNKKGFISLDVFDASEYNPFELVSPRPAPLKITVNTQTDPLLQQQRNRDEEDRTIIQCDTGEIMSSKEIDRHHLPPLPLVPLGRHGTECSTWLAMPLHDIESPVRIMSRRRMQPIPYYSQFNFSHSSNPLDASVVDEELNIQKRRHYDTPLFQQQTAVVGIAPPITKKQSVTAVAI